MEDRGAILPGHFWGAGCMTGILPAPQRCKLADPTHTHTPTHPQGQLREVNSLAGGHTAEGHRNPRPACLRFPMSTLAAEFIHASEDFGKTATGDLWKEGTTVEEALVPILWGSWGGRIGKPLLKTSCCVNPES